MASASVTVTVVCEVDGVRQPYNSEPDLEDCLFGRRLGAMYGGDYFPGESIIGYRPFGAVWVLNMDYLDEQGRYVSGIRGLFRRGEWAQGDSQTEFVYRVWERIA
jgi:hypothetical protein